MAMNSFEYGDNQISERELTFAVASMMIGISILVLPRVLANSTELYDGVLCIIFGGVISMGFAWLIAKIALQFPQQSFFSYTSLLLSKPVAYFISFISAVFFFVLTAFQAKSLAQIAKQYLFDRTPIEAIVFTFLLLVIYGVAGTRVGLFRLNVMFLPIVVLMLILSQLLVIKDFKFDNIRPFFVTDGSGYLRGTLESFTSYYGFIILFFYISLLKNPKKAARAAVNAVALPIFIYVLIYTFAIGVFSNSVASNIIYPTIELSKEVDLPGAFIERFDSIFFTIWMMTVFNTSTLALDISLISIRPFLPKVKKIIILSCSAPFLYLVAILPKNLVELVSTVHVLSYVAFFLSFILPVLLFLAMKWRKIGHG
jgi:spore germination protein